MSYDLIGEIVQYLQYRLNFLEDGLIRKQVKSDEIAKLRESNSVFRRFGGIMLSLFFSTSPDEIDGLKTEINQYGEAIEGLRREEFHGAIQILENLEKYFASGPEQEILMQRGIGDTQSEKIQFYIRHLKSLQEDRVNMLQIT
ncbi:MAG: hypothetical protein ABH967_02455 [Patescibacteria group bacterium]